MFNDLAGKFLSIVSVKGQQEDNINDDIKTGRLPQIQASDGGQPSDIELSIGDDDGDYFDEWVLLDDESEADNDGSSISDDVDLLLSPGGDDDSTTTTTTTSNTDIDVLSPPGSAACGADSSMHQSGWQLTPPPCFTASAPPTGRRRNKYKHAKHRNANLAAKSGGQQRLAGSGAPSRAEAAGEFSVVGNLLIEHPDPVGLRRLYGRQVLGVRQCGYGAALPSDMDASEDFDSMDRVENDNLDVNRNFDDVSGGRARAAGDKENVDNAAVSVIGSVTTPVYVVIGENVCAKPMSRRPVSSGCRLEINPQLQERAALSSGAGGRRAKRQHFTAYDPCVFGANKLGTRGRQRKDRVKNLATSRSNDHKGQ